MELIAYLFGYFPIHEFYIGEIAVYLFFMISGFVISITALNCTTMGEFAYRRFSRLYPVYWGGLIFMALTIMLFGAGRAISVTQMLFNLMMLHEYVHARHIAAVFWSLTVELSFYFLVACVIGLGLMPYRRPLLLAWSLLIFLYGFYSIPNPIPWPVVKLLVLNHRQFFIYGIAVYELWKAKQAETGVTDRFYLLLIAISIASCMVRYPAVVFIILIGIHALFYLAVMKKLAFLRNRLLVYLGGISYALYLEHSIIGPILMDHLALPRAVEIVAASIAALLAALALTSLIERPALGWLRRQLPRLGHATRAAQPEQLTLHRTVDYCAARNTGAA